VELGGCESVRESAAAEGFVDEASSVDGIYTAEDGAGAEGGCPVAASGYDGEGRAEVTTFCGNGINLVGADEVRGEHLGADIDVVHGIGVNEKETMDTEGGKLSGNLMAYGTGTNDGAGGVADNVEGEEVREA